jgi:hypothetical protein
MTTDKRQKMLAIGAGVAVALLAGDHFVLAPLSKAWSDRSARIAELRKSIERGGQVVAREQSVRDHWDNMRTNALPADTSAAEALVFSSVNDWIRDSGATFNSEKPQWKHEEDYTTFDCRIDVTGDIRSLSKFLYDFEKSPLAFKVDMVEITARDTAGQQLALGLQMNGLVLGAPTQP